MLRTRLYNQSRLKLLVITTTLMLNSCTSTMRQPNTLEAIEQSLNTSYPEKKPDTTSINNALLPPVNINVPGDTGIDTESRFDIKVNRVTARVFFMGLVQGTPYNMIVHPKVKGTITLDLKNLTIIEVLNTVRDVYGYDYEKVSTGFQVYPNAMRTRLFKIDYLDVVREGTSNMRVSSGQVSDTKNNTNSSSRNRSNSSSNTNRSANGSNSTSGSKISTKSSSDFWKQLTQSIKSIVGTKTDRKVIVNKHSGVVVVHAMPDELRAVNKFINETQNIIQRQVIIEAKIIEVELSDNFQSGINWAALGRSSGGNSTILARQTGTSPSFGSGIIETSDLGPVNNTEAFGGVFSLAVKIGNSFAGILDLLQTQGDVQVLSSPQVSTINNQKAVIKVGQDEFFITNVTSNTNTNVTTSSTQSNVELTPFFSGVALDVIPQISADGNITLHIHPTVSKVIEKSKQISFNNDNTLTVPLALSTVRESDTIIRAQDGQVVIIGGLMQNTTVNDDSNVPFLGDIPLVGNLFKHTSKAYKKSELVILLRPIIVKDNIQWASRIKKIQSRIGNLYSPQVN